MGIRADDRAGSSGGLSIRLDGEGFQSAMRAMRSADRKAYLALRREIRSIASDMTSDVKEAIGRIPSSGRYGTGIRASLQQGTRASIRMASARTAGVQIVTSPSRLPEKKRPLAKALNRESFRHPVRGNRDYWVKQQGRPYFGSVILGKREVAQRRIEVAIRRVARDIARSTNA